VLNRKESLLAAVRADTLHVRAPALEEQQMGLERAAAALDTYARECDRACSAWRAQPALGALLGLDWQKLYA
jgi:hypothetical protein